MIDIDRILCRERERERERRRKREREREREFSLHSPAVAVDMFVLLRLLSMLLLLLLLLLLRLLFLLLLLLLLLLLFARARLLEADSPDTGTATMVSHKSTKGASVSLSWLKPSNAARLAAASPEMPWSTSASRCRSKARAAAIIRAGLPAAARESNAIETALVCITGCSAATASTYRCLSATRPRPPPRSPPCSEEGERAASPSPSSPSAALPLSASDSSFSASAESLSARLSATQASI